MLHKNLFFAIECDSVGSGYQGIAVDEESLIKLAIQLAVDSLEYERYDEETLYRLRRELYAMMRDSLLHLPENNSALAAFAQSFVNSPEQKFFDVTRKLELMPNYILMNELLTSNSATDSLFALFHQTDSLMKLQNDIPDQEFQNEMMSHYLAWENATEATQVLRNQYLTEKATLNHAARADNAQIASQREFEIFERTINEIYARTVADGNLVFMPDDRTTIDYIAGLCPLAGGVAVYNARSMQMMYNDTMIYNDHQLCRMQGIAYRESAENIPSKASDIHIYPVPSSNLLTIKLNNEQVTNTPFKIYNLLGKQIYNGNIRGNQIDLNLKGICSSNGMYLIEILLVNGKINTKKFIYEGY